MYDKNHHFKPVGEKNQEPFLGCVPYQKKKKKKKWEVGRISTPGYSLPNPVTKKFIGKGSGIIFQNWYFKEQQSWPDTLKDIPTVSKQIKAFVSKGYRQVTEQALKHVQRCSTSLKISQHFSSLRVAETSKFNNTLHLVRPWGIDTPMHCLWVGNLVQPLQGQLGKIYQNYKHICVFFDPVISSLRFIYLLLIYMIYK